MDRSDTSVLAPVTVEQPVEHEVEPQVEAGGAGQHADIHLPPTSLWPITLAFAIAVMASGLVLNWMVSVPGLILFILALRGWAQELLHARH